MLSSSVCTAAGSWFENVGMLLFGLTLVLVIGWEYTLYSVWVVVLVFVCCCITGQPLSVCCCFEELSCFTGHPCCCCCCCLSCRLLTLTGHAGWGLELFVPIFNYMCSRFYVGLCCVGLSIFCGVLCCAVMCAVSII